MMHMLRRINKSRLVCQCTLLLAVSVLLGLFGFHYNFNVSAESHLVDQSTKAIPRISIEALRVMLKDNQAICIDARNSTAYGEGHIPGAISVPFDNLDQSMSTHLEVFSSNKPIVLYCGSVDCGLSDLLADKLIALGFVKVMVFSGGWDAWKKTEQPTKR